MQYTTPFLDVEHDFYHERLNHFTVFPIFSLLPFLMSQTSELSFDLEYLTIRSHDDNSSDTYSFISITENGDIGFSSSNINSEYSDEAQEQNVDKNERKSGFVNYLMEAFDSLSAHFTSVQAVDLATRVAHRRIYHDIVVEKATELIGEEAARQLAIVGSIQGVNTNKINKGIKLMCDGEKVHGKKTIKQLVDSNIISERGSKYDSSNKKIHLNLIAAAIPHAAFQSMNTNSHQVPRKKNNQRISTSLPVQLQYLQAAALPLGTNTRKAHLFWSSQYLKSIHCKFNPTIYKKLMNQAIIYEKTDALTKKLDYIEASLIINKDEEAIQIKQFFKKYYAIAQIAKSKKRGA
ncbi:hypothetical protein [Parasitella parasitica]|uniref:Uncharacterized protein n=1 Tax=Parasitella parasitica TaxID=35722 RepID=A0A0B7MRH5_9FUNG|nr:hypothetical protein [Parasitella parasitica]